MLNLTEVLAPVRELFFFLLDSKELKIIAGLRAITNK